ncbi:hypothetical protein EV356DRAFT_503509 [Viridothelium virens]|uniref:Uncharacterized protein n=1 Tax=Viridothelium virens TaxID=1048519 RepID=A0A6A6H6E8_VIRVR|nr:hypothetical protein EV356DRAFT_503509 [Viridothelium virens]
MTHLLIAGCAISNSRACLTYGILYTLVTWQLRLGRKTTERPVESKVYTRTKSLRKTVNSFVGIEGSGRLGGHSDTCNNPTAPR